MSIFTLSQDSQRCGFQKKTEINTVTVGNATFNIIIPIHTATIHRTKRITIKSDLYITNISIQACAKSKGKRLTLPPMPLRSGQQ